MATGIKLTQSELRALRVLAAYDPGWVPETYLATSEDPGAINYLTAVVLVDSWLVDRTLPTGSRPAELRIRARGRQVLAEHDAGDG